MSVTVLLAVLAAAFLHAGWNALVKAGGNKLTNMAILTLVQGALGAVIVFTRPLPANEVWVWLIASGLTHSAYKLFLSYAYEQGDLSRVYPIARGAAPMIVAVAGIFMLADRIKPTEYLGIFVIGLGILMMARGVFQSGESRRLLPFALGSAIATASYSLIDGLGARIAGDAAMFVAWMFLFDAGFFSLAAIGLRGRPVFSASAREWRIGAAAAFASYAAYAIAVWAMTRAPIALVTSIRETSILFAVLIGWLVFGERMHKGKAIAAFLIVAGIVVTRF